MSTGDRARHSLSEAVQEPMPKPALGSPHDTWAAVGMTLAVAGALFFGGRAQVVADALGWSGMLVSLAAAIGFTLYFQRAYGFSSRAWGHAPMGAVAAAIFGFMVVLQLVPAALYDQYFKQSLLGYSTACVALAMLPVGILRAGLGRASRRRPAQGGVESADGDDPSR